MTNKHTQNELSSFTEEDFSNLFSSNEDNVLDKIASLIEYFIDNPINYEKLNIKDYNSKVAYPNVDHYMHVPGQHNTDKWLQAVKDLYYKEKTGENRGPAIGQVTAGWHPNETYDFLNWLRFYEGGNHLKYAVASYYTNGDPGYWLPVDKRHDLFESAVVHPTDVNNAKDSSASDVSPVEKKKIIEKQRSKIISRLDSAEKLLRSDEGEIFAGKELESLMETIFNLKKKIQLVNKISTSSMLYEDMIIREANLLVKNGFNTAAEALYIIAEGAGTKELPNPAPAKAPTDGGEGSAGGLPAATPAGINTETAPKNENSPVEVLETKPKDQEEELTVEDSTPDEPVVKEPTESAVIEESKGMESFLDAQKDGLSEGFSTIAYYPVKELDVLDGEDLIVEAQATPAPTPAPAPVVPVPSTTPVAAPSPEALEEEPLEVEELDPDRSLTLPSSTTSEFDNQINSLFSNIKIEDVVSKLEDLSKIFKTREVPRQLAIVDMMLDSLGIASYFPALSEATNKSLESNNYIATRVEDVLSKLRGALKTKNIDLVGGEAPLVNTPEMVNLRSNLEQDQQKDKVRKELRKQKQDEELSESTKEIPELEVTEDLTEAPAAPIAPAPPAAAPAAPPTAAPATPSVPPT
jgi:hypothetical protein